MPDQPNSTALPLYHEKVFALERGRTASFRIPIPVTEYEAEEIGEYVKGVLIDALEVVDA